MAAKWDQWVADRAERAKRNIAVPGTNIYQMVDPAPYWGGAKDRERFLTSLRLNFSSHGHQLPRGGPYHVKYPISILDACSNHQNQILRQMAITDHWKWACDLSAESDPCLQDFDLFCQEMAKLYGNKDRQCVAVITLMQGFILLPQELVTAHANHLKANWRQGGWNLQKHEDVLFDITWAGLRNSRKNKVGPMTTTCGRLDTLDEVFDKAVASEVTDVENMNPQQQQHQQQQLQQKQPTDTSSNGGK